MTGKELILSLKIQINKLDSDSNKVLYPEVALKWLNSTYLDLVRAKYSADYADNSSMLKGQKSEDDLVYLMKPYTISGKTSNKGKLSINVSDINNYLHYLDIDSLTVDDEPIIELSDKPVGFKDSVDPFNKSTKLYPTIQHFDGKITLDFGDADLDISGTLQYLSAPEEITLNDDVIIPFYDELINTAAIEILENWEDNRFSSKAQVDQAIKEY